MMDYLQPRPQPPVYGSDRNAKNKQGLTITLLPGSRPPEAYANWQKILVAVAGLCRNFSLAFAIFGCDRTGLNLEPLRQILVEAGFQEMSSEELKHHHSPLTKCLTFEHQNASSSYPTRL